MTIIGREKLQKVMAPETPLPERLVVTPILDWERQVGDGSIDIRLGTHFIVVKTAQIGGIEPFDRETQTEILRYQETVYIGYSQKLWMHPGTFVLGSTLEYLHLPPNLHADVTARSSWARLGLSIASAFAVHPGFYGCLTLELVNNGNTPVAIHPGDRIGQLTFHEVEPPQTEDPTELKYEGDIHPGYSRLSRELRERGRWQSLGKSLRVP